MLADMGTAPPGRVVAGAKPLGIPLTFTPGERLGPYEIVDLVDARGHGGSLQG
jgi:hypothetical protein